MELHFDIEEPIASQAITTTPLDSELWEQYQGAYGSALPDIVDLIKQNPTQEELAIALENLRDNLEHQLSFYPASYLCVPYLIKLLEQKEAEHDFWCQWNLITIMGRIALTDIPYNHTDYKSNADTLIEENYKNSMSVLREKTKHFLMHNLERLKLLGSFDKSEFSTAVLAVLGDRETAFLLENMLFDLFLVKCSGCQSEQEELPGFRDGGPAEITPAPPVIGSWDGSSLEDLYLWFSNFLHLLGLDHAAQALSWYYGTYTCPNCGKQDLVLTVVRNYYDMPTIADFRKKIKST